MTLLNTGSVADIMVAKAKALASKESSAMATSVAVICDAKLETQGGPIKVMLAMAENYGEETMNSFPEVGMEDGNNPAKFKIIDGDKSRVVDFYTLFTHDTKAGGALLARKNMLKQAKEVNLSNVSDDIKSLAEGEESLKGEIIKVESRLNNMVNAYRNGMKFYQKLRDVNGLPGLTASPIMTATGELERTAKPVIVRHATDASKFRFFSTNTFMGLDLKAIRDGGGTYASLMKELEREGGKGQGKVKTTTPEVKDVAEWKRQFIGAANYLSAIWDDKKGEGYGRIFKELNAAGSDELILAIFNVKAAVEDIARHDRIAARYAALEDGSAEPATKAA